MKATYRIYCAGPLFNSSEQEEMLRISEALESLDGIEAFVPHRDGLLFSELFPILVQKGIGINDACDLLRHAIFCLDVYEIYRCDGLMLNLNGRVPDEGAAVEAGIAWALGKPVVIFKSDPRSLAGGYDNPLLDGLFDFDVAFDSYENAAKHMVWRLKNDLARPPQPFRDSILDRGKKISEYMLENTSYLSDALADFLINLYRGKYGASNEDKCDLDLAEQALKRNDTIPWDEVKREIEETPPTPRRHPESRRQKLSSITFSNPSNGVIPLPEKFVGQFYNACTDPCDIVDGPCACGASHHLEFWPDDVIDAVYDERVPRSGKDVGRGD